ncbi:uncharacterized protein LOC108250651 [Kryptolebias marmoratus]|uniref:Uncharacterized LOC108247455 n=2 Tax=Kryptolebias marmoratus TaxID=37003 RepID=A0A3Q3AKD5_KRYMA|nr:uncharacterized protein LOC108247455 [Kryptolebias marmoratus]XP_017294267.3 uncharacterized protein LOC108249395 [Kryptolebias marmoratus]XP_017296128.1 uncharacterized protein LOC108250651 [Kryptolebias marmoratus]
MPDVPTVAQTPATSTPFKPVKRPRLEEEPEDDPVELDTIPFIDCEDADPLWNLNTSDILEASIDDDDDDIDEENTGSLSDSKLFAVEKGQLVLLFNRCHQCGLLGASAVITSTEGCQVRIEQSCLGCESKWIWKGQSLVGGYPAGNLALSTAILSAGALPGKTLRVLKFWGMQAISPATFFTHQRRFLHQAVRNVWNEEQERVLGAMQTTAILSGDARCDSMGHCAKYGSYSLHDTIHNKIICTELVQSNEVKSSNAMELHGLKKALSVIEEAKPDAQIVLTTDGHKSVAKWLREEKADKVKHHLDIWHVSKGLWKKLSGLAKKFPLVAKWMKGIRRHLYWCAQSSNGDPELMVAKWKSVANHIANIHVHEDKRFPECCHGKIYREWFDPASEAYDKVSRILLAKQLLVAVAKLSPDGQTSGLEGFHGTVIHFAPKMYHFGYNGMKTRLQVAALHFNENAGREQRVAEKTGQSCHSIHFPKAKKGEYIVRAVKVDRTYRYAEKIATEVKRLVNSRKTHEIGEVPPPLCSKYTKPTKDTAITEHSAHMRYRNK